MTSFSAVLVSTLFGSAKTEALTVRFRPRLLLQQGERYEPNRASSLSKVAAVLFDLRAAERLSEGLAPYPSLLHRRSGDLAVLQSRHCRGKYRDDLSEAAYLYFMFRVSK